LSGRSPAVLRPQNPTARPLAEIAEHFELTTGSDLTGIAVTGVSVVASQVQPGDLYVGVRGAHRHGASFTEEARSRGAVALLTDADGRGLLTDDGMPVLEAPSPRALLGALSARVYDTANPGLSVFGVTGTNGKTSTAYLLDAILRQLGLRTGLSTTAERVIDGERSRSTLTTPEAPEIHAMLALMAQRGLDAVTLEVSAQALTRHRVDGVLFDVVGFTNLSHDHLDDYGTMEAYLAAKAQLFEPERARRSVVSLDSDGGAALATRLEIPCVTVSARPDIDAQWRVEVVDEHPERTRFRLTGASGQQLVTSVPLIGHHMAANAALAIVMLVEAGHPLSEIEAALSPGGIDAYLPGRAERVSGRRGPSLYVDFAHSADAFSSTLAAVRRFTSGRVIMVCGASGDRDPTKRTEMGRVAAEGSDLLIVTDHHPRHEDPALIRAALLDGARRAPSATEILEIVPPEQAIRVAVSRAEEGDSILWAGPGHLDYRDVAGHKVPFSAREIARAALREGGW